MEPVDYIDCLRKRANNLTRNHHQAEDLLQDTLYRAYSRIELFQEGTDMRRWLFTIMRNIHFNNLSKKQPVLSELPVEDVEASQEKSFLPVEYLPLLEALPQHFATYFMQKHAGFSCEEIADKNGVPTGSVQSALFRARKRMVNELVNY